MYFLYLAKYFFKIFKLLLLGIGITYFLGCSWYLSVKYLCDETQTDSCFLIFFTDIDSPYDRLIICCYFILTTLSTVGYGDFTPISNNEKLLCIILMICGVAFFSYIMSHFTDIVLNHQKNMGIVDFTVDLQIWMVALSQLSKNPLEKQVIKQIFQNFKYHWASNRIVID